MSHNTGIRFRHYENLKPFLYPILGIPQKNHWQDYGMYLDLDEKYKLLVAYCHCGDNREWACFAEEVLFACPFFEAAYSTEESDPGICVELFVFDLSGVKEIWTSPVTGR